MRYDPLTDPDPAAWLELDESLRIDAVVEYHRREAISLPDAKMHALVHVIVENVLAEQSVEGVRDKLRELMADGLDRHEAVHALGTVSTEVMADLLQSEGPKPTPAEVAQLLAQRMAKLSAVSWRALAEDADPGPPWIVDLCECEDKIDKALERRIVALGSDAVLPLVQLIEEDLDSEDGTWAAAHAAKLLGKLGDPRAVDPLIRAIESSESGDMLRENATLGLPNLGEPVIEPVLARVAALAVDDDDRLAWCEVLSRIGVRDDRISGCSSRACRAIRGFSRVALPTTAILVRCRSSTASSRRFDSPASHSATAPSSTSSMRSRRWATS